MAKKKLSMVAITLIVFGVIFGVYSNNQSISACATNIHSDISSQSVTDGSESYRAITAVNLASIIKKSPDIGQAVGNVFQGIQIVNLYNQLHPNIDNNLGTHLPSINIDANVIQSSEKFTPILGPYNDLRQCAFALDPNDSSSVDRFYLSLADFTIDTALISTGGLELATKQGTGVVVNVMKDTKVEEKIVSMCEHDCTKQFEDHTRYFVSVISGQLLPTANTAINNIFNYFKNIH